MWSSSIIVGGRVSPPCIRHRRWHLMRSHFVLLIELHSWIGSFLLKFLKSSASERFHNEAESFIEDVVTWPVHCLSSFVRWSSASAAESLCLCLCFCLCVSFSKRMRSAPLLSAAAEWIGRCSRRRHWQQQQQQRWSAESLRWCHWTLSPAEQLIRRHGNRKALKQIGR